MPRHLTVTPAERARRDRHAAAREATRVYKDDEGHTWAETAEHFGLGVGAVQHRVYLARKERASEARDAVEPPLPLVSDPQQTLDLDR